MIVIEALAEYLANATDHAYGTSCFSYEMPDAPDECIGVEHINTEGNRHYTSMAADLHVDASVYPLRILVRADGNHTAMELATKAYTAMVQNDGFIELDGCTVAAYVYGEPTWLKSDQKGRKTFSFEVSITTARPSSNSERS